MIDTEIKYENEIELMDILLVVWRWKIFILGFTALIMLTAFICLFFLKNIYRASMIIEPIVLEQKVDGSEYYVDTAENIKSLIESNELNDQIAEKLGSKNISTDNLLFGVNIKMATNKILVSLDHPSPDNAVEILKTLIVILNEQCRTKIDHYIEKQKEKMIQIDAEIAVIQNIKKDIEHIESRIIDISGNIKNAEKQYQVLLVQQKALLSNVSGRSISDTLILFNSISLITSRLDSLQNLLYNLENDKIKKQRELITAGYGVTEFDTKQLNKELIQNRIIRANLIQANKEAIHTLNPPMALSAPVKPKKRLILSLAFISGLLISLLSAFFLEYFRNYKNREHRKKKVNIDNAI